MRHAKCILNFKRIRRQKPLKVERDLIGPEKKRLLEQIDISTLFPSHPRKDDVQKLWSDFNRLVELLSGSTECNPEEFDVQAKQWVNCNPEEFDV